MISESGKHVENYRLRFSSHFIQAWPILIYATIIVLAPLYYFYRYGEDGLAVVEKVAVVFFLLALIPHAVVHLKYWLLSRNTEAKFDIKNKIITYKDENFEITFKARDVEKAATTISKAKANNTFRCWPWDNYCYSVIYLKSGEKLLLTSLLIPELIWPIKIPNENFTAAYICWPKAVESKV